MLLDWKRSFDSLTPEQKINKERDIRICLAEANDEIKKNKFSEQLEYVVNQNALALQLTLNRHE
jgi:hypothetical protein